MISSPIQMAPFAQPKLLQIIGNQWIFADNIVVSNVLIDGLVSLGKVQFWIQFGHKLYMKSIPLRSKSLKGLKPRDELRLVPYMQMISTGRTPLPLLYCINSLTQVFSSCWGRHCEEHLPLNL